MLFSVIVPVHNMERYLDECIESIINQKVIDFELILIINASTDNSYQICDKWGKRDRRIIIIETDIPGVSNARNMGLSVANGEWIIFIDADDFVLNNAFIELKNNISDSVDMVVGNYTQTNCPKNLTGKKRILTSFNYMCAMLDSPRYFKDVECGLTWNAGILGVNWAKAFRKSIIDYNNISFSTDITVFEDLLFNLDFLSVTSFVKCFDVPIYYYRISENSLSRTVSEKRVRQRLNYIDMLLDRKENGELQKAIRFQAGQNILRTFVVASRRLINNSELRKELNDYVEKPTIQNLLMELREDNLSIGKMQNLFYRVILNILKNKQYSLVYILCWLYSKLKKKD